MLRPWVSPKLETLSSYICQNSGIYGINPVPGVAVNTTTCDRHVFPSELRGWISGRVIKDQNSQEPLYGSSRRLEQISQTMNNFLCGSSQRSDLHPNCTSRSKLDQLLNRVIPSHSNIAQSLQHWTEVLAVPGDDTGCEMPYANIWYAGSMNFLHTNHDIDKKKDEESLSNI